MMTLVMNEEGKTRKGKNRLCAAIDYNSLRNLKAASYSKVNFMPIGVLAGYISIYIYLWDKQVYMEWHLTLFIYTE
jgi:hypothetical protein